MIGNVIRFIIPLMTVLVSLIAPMNAVAQQYWEDDPGGIFNPPPVEYNPIYYGYGSSDNIVYNKIDLQDGRSMQMEKTTLYDNTGEPIATAWESGIGRVDGQRDGGLIAGSIYKFKIDGQDKWMTYAWSVNSSLGGRQSGWIDVDALSPNSDIVRILTQTKRDRLALFEDETQHNNYQRYTVQETRLPAYMEEYYLDPGRSASYSAGKAKYYYSRDGYLTLLKNIPETGSQRYGVAHDIAPEGASFYRDMTVDRVEVNIYPASSYSEESHTLNLVWGYTETSAGDSIFSWVNERGLRAVDDPAPSASATLHQHYSQGGDSYELEVGDYSWLPSAGIPNDDISSVTVPNGYTLVLYQNWNFGGRSITLQSDTTLRNFNDQASSAKFFKN